MNLFCLLNASFHNSKYLCGCGLSAKHLWKTSILIVGIDWDCVINGPSCPICSDTHSHITPPSPPHSELWSPLHGKEVSRGDFFNQGVCLVHTRETKRRKLPSYANLQAFRKSQQKANSKILWKFSPQIQINDALLLESLPKSYHSLTISWLIVVREAIESFNIKICRRRASPKPGHGERQARQILWQKDRQENDASWQEQPDGKRMTSLAGKKRFVWKPAFPPSHTR